MTLKSMLLFRSAMTKSGEKGQLTGVVSTSTFEPIKVEKITRKS